MRFRLLFVAVAFSFCTTGLAVAQTTTGSVRGYVTDQLGTPAANATVGVANTQTGVQRTTMTDARGFYALLGLTPGEYTVTVRKIGMAPQSHTVRVQIGEVLSADFQMAVNPIALNPLVVTAMATGIETRTSEVATNVTPQQIQALPNASANFLNLAALAPGVTVSPDLISPGANGVPQRTFTAVGQGPGEVNVFVDGASLKNDLTGGESGAGGTAGQDASRGNPFPLNAIQEYRVVSQNFKAEYQRSSSAIITAVTKSGGTAWTGDASIKYSNQGMMALDTFQNATRAANPGTFTRPGFSRYLLDLSAGGPIMGPKLRFFGSYEGNYQDRASTVDIVPSAGVLTRFPALDTVPFSSFNGAITSPFRETLLFGKLSYVPGDRSTVELSVNTRAEHDIRDYGGGTTFQSANYYRQVTTLGILKHTYTMANALNEATISYGRFRRNPAANDSGIPSRLYNIPTTPSVGAAILGSAQSYQDFIQDRLGLRDDFTYTGFHWNGDHVVKAGVNADLLTYNISKQNNFTPRFYYDSLVNRSGQVLNFNYRVPDQLVYSPAITPFLNTHNTQLGVYAQDDWSPTRQLTVNLGVRWDYESHMFNTGYVTPTAIADTITKYSSQLQMPEPLSSYITDGHQRKQFLGAFQPRLGFSYALDRDNRTTVFGGWGIFYDRSYFDISVDETQKITNPTYTILFADPDSVPKAGEVAWNNRYLTSNRRLLDSLATGGSGSGKEVWLIPNDIKPPKSYQFNLGVRHLFGDVLVSLTYAGVRGVDGLTFGWANIPVNPNGSCCVFANSPFHGFSNILFLSNSVKTWYDALQVQVDRPYRRSARGMGWGAGINYTYATRSLEGAGNLDDEFTFPHPDFWPKHASNDEKGHVVANWVLDLPFAYGVQFSGLITLGTGSKLDIGSPFNLPNGVFKPGAWSPPKANFILPHAWAYRDVDIRLAKDFPSFRGNTVGITLDIFNVFNFVNYGWGVSDTGVGSRNAGAPLSDPRRMQLGATYHF